MHPILPKASEFLLPEASINEAEMRQIIAEIEAEHPGVFPCLAGNIEYFELEEEKLKEKIPHDTLILLRNFAIPHAEAETKRASDQAMEALVHNLNTMHSRAGAQTPFSSINYGMDTSQRVV